MKFEPTLSCRFLVYIYNYLSDINVDPQPLFSSSAISYPVSDAEEMPVPFFKITDLLEKIAQQNNNPYVGLHLAQRYHYESAGMMILTMLAAPNVKEGIKTLCQYDRYIDTALDSSIEIGAKASAFKVNLINTRNVATNQLAEFLLIHFIDILKKGTRSRMPVTEVSFMHTNNFDATPIEHHLGTTVKYGQIENKIVFRNSFLKKSFITSNNLLFEILKNSQKHFFDTSNEKNEFLGVVCREIIRLTKDTIPNLSKVSSSLGMSERTLRRHLSSEGFSFQEAKNIARKKRAQYFLSDTRMSLTEIAYELGFSELSAFSRAFRQWLGETPQEYRNNFKKQ